MNFAPSSRITPWVLRLIIANAVVLLLMRTIFISPALASALAFSPTDALREPWTFLSYMFVHAGLLHLLGNMFMLWVFGTPVENRMGSRTFILYYLLCGVGAAVFSLALSGIMNVSPFVGASGAVLGVALAFAIYWPDAELIVFPLPIPIRARTLVALLVGLDVFFYFLTPGDGVAHLAHVGGVLFGYLYFRMQGFSRRSPQPPPRAVERVVMVQSGSAEPERRTPVTPARPRRRADADPVAAEVDRVLDKISEKGIASLTPAERRFLDEVSRQKKGEH
ncbi:MAG TPA: rhomboid family intramembrane serine protease [Gemmatimonadales bacterium]|nr:rhomboid family intramembrane serine protease [Gemmatimonadales bacterium]